MPKSRALSDEQTGVVSGGSKELIYASADSKKEKNPIASVLRSNGTGRIDFMFTNGDMQKKYEPAYAKALGVNLDAYKKEDTKGNNKIC